jgi:hypothetical protein
MMRRGTVLSTALAFVVAAAGCGDHDHDQGPGGPAHGPDGRTHGAAAGGTAAAMDDHGKMLELGEQKLDHFAVKASREEGALVAGKDTAVDVWVGFNAADPNPAAVRVWIGTADGKGALKAKADLAPPTKRHHFHTHAEIPADLAAGHALQVEIEDTTGKSRVASFDLKR